MVGVKDLVSGEQVDIAEGEIIEHLQRLLTVAGA